MTDTGLHSSSFYDSRFSEFVGSMRDTSYKLEYTLPVSQRLVLDISDDLKNTWNKNQLVVTKVSFDQPENADHWTRDIKIHYAWLETPNSLANVFFFTKQKLISQYFSFSGHCGVCNRVENVSKDKSAPGKIFDPAQVKFLLESPKNYKASFRKNITSGNLEFNTSWGPNFCPDGPDCASCGGMDIQKSYDVKWSVPTGNLYLTDSADDQKKVLSYFLRGELFFGIRNAYFLIKF
jgi:hypothetical protein